MSISESQDKHRVIILCNMVFEKFSHVIRVMHNMYAVCMFHIYAVEGDYMQ